MKRWVNWVLGRDDYLSNKNPFLIVGRIILSIWMLILAICALVIGGMFLTNPGDFIEPEPDNDCVVVEYNGETIDTCEYLTE
jgi:hypothetical protein